MKPPWTPEELQLGLRTAVRQGDWDQARELARQALAMPNVDRGHNHALLGQIEVKRGDQAAAQAHLTQALALGMDDPNLMLLLADCLQETEPDRAAKALQMAAKHPRATATMALRWAQYQLISLGDPRTALPWYSQAAAMSGHARAWAGVCAAAAAIGDAETADTAALALVAAQPDAASLQLAAEAMATNLAGTIGFSALLTALSAIVDDGAWLSLLQAQRCLAQGQRAKAIDWLQRAVTADEQAAQAWRILGELLILQGDLSRASTHLDKARSLGADVADGELALADALRRTGEPHKARQRLEKLLEIAPYHVGAWLELSKVTSELADNAAADNALRRAMALDPKVDREAGQSARFIRETIHTIPQLFQQLSMAPLSGAEAPLRLHTGHNAVIVEVGSGQQTDFFVKVTLPGSRDRAHVQATAELESRLHAQVGPAIAVPQSLATSDSVYAFPCAGGYAQLMRPVPGQPLDRLLTEPRQGLTLAHAKSLGHALGQLHDMLDLESDWQRPMPRAHSLLALGQWHDIASNWQKIALDAGLVGVRDDLVAAVRDHLCALLPRLETILTDLPTALIHGDFGWHNALWQGTDVVSVVDFDFAQAGVRMEDLLSAMLRMAVIWRDLAFDGKPTVRPEIAAEFLRAWCAVAGPLPLAQVGDVDVLLRASRVAYHLDQIANLRNTAQDQSAVSAQLVQTLIMQLRWLQSGGSQQLLPEATLRSLS